MDVIETIRSIEISDDFSRWKNVNEDAYLTSAFSMYSEGQKREWLVSYYNSKTGKMTSFSADNKQAQEEAFKKEETIPKLKTFEIQIKDDKAIELANKILQDDYNGETLQRTVLVLQKINTEPIWNITMITIMLKVINLKLSAITGKEISRKASNINDFVKHRLDS
ncbi:hypothetical protein CMO88_04280 [Candidatus Woesearchaeota archaeon]|nr:hypothetical protein [Candidatus Woesearchaeota archaeon]|tara:strand:- start:1009 stop:1506 length:498 start_codon:yes stop_codon:yes gene_type:complete